MEIREQVLEVKMIVTDLSNSFNPVPKNKTEKRTEKDRKWTNKKEKIDSA